MSTTPPPARAASPIEPILRIVAAAAILIGGLVHLYLYFRGGYRSIPDANLGRSFLLNGFGSVAVAAVMLVRRDVIVRLAGIAISVGTLIAFYLTRQTDKGIFGFTEKGFEPSPQAAIALVVEIVALVVLLASFVPALGWKRQPVINMAVGGALALAVVAIGIVGSVVWAHKDAATAAAPATDAVAIKDFSFQPTPMDVKVGDSVTWTNADATAHDIVADDGSFISQDQIATGQSFTQKFDKAGTFTYICGIHPQMKGTVIVAG